MGGSLDELKFKADKLLHDVFYKGLEAGEDTVLQYQFEREPAYRYRYIERCIKEARNELVDILIELTPKPPTPTQSDKEDKK